MICALFSIVNYNNNTCTCYFASCSTCLRFVQYMFKLKAAQSRGLRMGITNNDARFGGVAEFCIPNDARLTGLRKIMH